MNWADYFKLLSDWKKLPAYKAEPRIDSLVGYYLPDFISDYTGDTINGVIPELPLRLGTLKPKHENTNYADRSYKVDFYLLGSSGMNYLVEFKTDQGSRREKQDTYLKEAQAVSMKAIVDGILRIAKVSTYKKKYNYLLNKMYQLGLINSDKTYSGRLDDIEIIYVQPQDSNSSKCICFNWIAQWMRTKYKNDQFEIGFANLLDEWSS